MWETAVRFNQINLPSCKPIFSLVVNDDRKLYKELNQFYHYLVKKLANERSDIHQYHLFVFLAKLRPLSSVPGELDLDQSQKLEFTKLTGILQR